MIVKPNGMTSSNFDNSAMLLLIACRPGDLIGNNLHDALS